MGPFIPSITLTDSDGVTQSIITNETACPGDIGAHGTVGFAMTSKGRPVMVWKANPDNSLRYKYFCHGFALDTYRRFGYSVCSDADILRALEDDYVEIGAGQSASDTIQLLKIGDIVSFAELSGKIIHTAKVFIIDINPSDPLRPVRFVDIILFSKNCFNVECLEPFLVTFINYPTIQRIRVWRARTCFDDTMLQ
jgi:hypothetical protein